MLTEVEIALQGKLGGVERLPIYQHQKNYENHHPLDTGGVLAFLSLLALSMQIGSDSGAWKPMFYCFLPMCFFFVGLATSQMQRKIRELRMQLAELQQKRVD